jgi:hypothetical protein
MATEVPLLTNHEHPDLDATLFDRNGINLIGKMQTTMGECGECGGIDQSMIDIIGSSPYCFTVKKTVDGCGFPIVMLHFFKHIYVIERRNHQRWEDTRGRVSCFHHTLTMEMLYAIKYFQISVDLYDFDKGMKIYKDYPERFDKRKRLEAQIRLEIRLEREALIEERRELERIRSECQREKMKTESIDLDEIILLKPQQTWR